MKLNIKVIPQAYLTPTGVCRSYGVIINNRPIRTYFSIDEVKAYIIRFKELEVKNDIK